MLETWVPSLGQEDPLEKEMATHSSTLAWRIPWTEKPGRLQSMGVAELDTTEQLHVTSNAVLVSDIENFKYAFYTILSFTKF